MNDVDRGIVAALLQRGRASYAEIGEKVGLSAPAVKRRVDRMQARGEITGFTALINPAMLGWGTEAYIEVYYKGIISAAELGRRLGQIPQVVGVWTVSGDADALVHVMASDMAEVEKTVERMREDPTIERTRSAIVMSRVFERPRG